MARIRAHIYYAEVHKFREDPGTRREVDRAAKGMAGRARMYAADLRETGEMLHGLTSYPSPDGSRASRAVSWQHDDYYAYFQNYGWREGAHRIAGRRFLERAYRTYTLR